MSAENAEKFEELLRTDEGLQAIYDTIMGGEE